MNLSLVLRSSALAGLLTAALSAHAVDAYTNLDPAPTAYDPDLAWSITSNLSQGFLFTAATTGTLSGLQVAMNNPPNDTTNKTFTLSLYSNTGSDELGSLIHAFDGLSTGVYNAVARNGFATVAITGAPIPITSGTKYWLVASGSDQFFGVLWNRANSATTKHVLISSLTSYSNSDRSGAFSVQVTPVPEPATLAALGIGAVGLLRKRRR